MYQFARFAKEFRMVPELFGMGKLRRIFFGSDDSSTQQAYGGTEAAQHRITAKEWWSRLWWIAQAAKGDSEPSAAMEYLLSEVNHSTRCC